MTVDERSLAAYQNQVDAMRKSPYLDFPAHVHLETNALCNAACNFCPYPTLERKGTKMPDALIAKIIEDLRDIPHDAAFSIVAIQSQRAVSRYAAVQHPRANQRAVAERVADADHQRLGADRKAIGASSAECATSSTCGFR